MTDPKYKHLKWYAGNEPQDFTRRRVLKYEGNRFFVQVKWPLSQLHMAAAVNDSYRNESNFLGFAYLP